MASTRLHEDLLKDFREQKELIYKQIESFDPLGAKMRQPAARRLVNKGALIFTEIICYLLSLSTVAFAVFLDKLYPFYLLSELRIDKEYKQLGAANAFNLTIGVYVLIGIIALSFYFIARCTRSIRLKNDILHFAGKQIKELVGQQLKRKASIEAIEQRHFIELPTLHQELSVNEVPNPGY